MRISHQSRARVGSDDRGMNAIKAIMRGKQDWMLLLQLDSDEELGAMWGDLGRLYFWIRREDFAAGNFDDVWCFLQSH